jgi:hypothetical protein
MGRLGLASIVVLLLGMAGCRGGLAFRAETRPCNVPRVPCSGFPEDCPSCAHCDWDTADITPQAGLHTRQAYLNIIRQEVNEDLQFGRVSAAMAERVTRAIIRHEGERNCDAREGAHAGKCNDILIRLATEECGTANSDSTWRTVATKLEQGH